MKKTLPLLFLALTVLLASCREAGKAVPAVPAATTAAETTAQQTAEFQRFLALRRARPETARADSSGGYRLAGGVLRVYELAGKEERLIWQSPESWYVEDFRLGDVDGDGEEDILFTVWKSYSFGARHPARMEHDSAAVRCHLFLYTRKGGAMKALWCSSNLPRPLYSFELRFNGKKTPVATGAVLYAQEGRYTEDFAPTPAREHVYSWEGWGFLEGFTG
ncbi:MAG: hypothetical protein LBG83_05555 [Oscillospiraceae bacterium]|jgi:hypothetical protein|nr:hypothetical protein [Oscillospiraceae bacterium]